MIRTLFIIVIGIFGGLLLIGGFVRVAGFLLAPGAFVTIQMMVSVYILWAAFVFWISQRFALEKNEATKIRSKKAVKSLEVNIKNVGMYRKLIAVPYIIIVGSILSMYLMYTHIMPEKHFEIPVIISFYLGAISAIYVISFYQRRGIRLDELYTYPAQFMDFEKRRVYVKKKLRNISINYVVAGCLSIVWCLIYLCDWIIIANLLLILTGSWLIRYRKLRSIDSGN